jgi:hypothetical protein
MFPERRLLPFARSRSGRERDGHMLACGARRPLEHHQWRMTEYARDVYDPVPHSHVVPTGYLRA